MISILFLLVFLGGLLFFGWQIVRFIFKEKKIEVLIPLSLAIGYGIYTFLLNISSYLIPIRLNFYFIFILLLIIGFIMCFLNKEKSNLKLELTKKEGWIVFGTVFIVMILSGLIASRSIEADDLAYPHLPLASLIAGGNFPVKNPNLPNYDLAIHYGPSLFYGAISKITGLSVLTSFRSVIFLFSGIVLLLLFNIAKLFIKQNLGSFFVGLVGFLGGGFRFIYIPDGLITLYKEFILHHNIGHPFGFLGEAWSVSPLSGPLVTHIFNNWFLFGWILALAIIYLYFKIINSKPRLFSCDILIIILLSVLAFTFEMSFIVICFGILIVPFIFYFKDKNKDIFKQLLKHSMLILGAVIILVLLQGGTITAILENIIQHKTSYGAGLGFSVFKNPLSFDPGNGTVFPFYGSTFILNFGLIYFLVIPAIIFMAKRQFKKSVFLVVISWFSFLVPLFISFNSWVWQGAMDRFFRFSSAIWAILVGLFLVIVFYQLGTKEIFKKAIIFLCSVIICLDGIFFLLTKPFYKKVEYRLDNSKFFAVLRPLSTAESTAYKWVKRNSTIRDYFLVFADKNDINNQTSVLENFRFVMFAQRLAPIYTQSNNYIDQALPIDDYYTPLYIKVVSNCLKEDVKKINYRYLFVDNNWPDGLEMKCLANNNLELKFETEKQDKFVRIYEVK